MPEHQHHHTCVTEGRLTVCYNSVFVSRCNYTFNDVETLMTFSFMSLLGFPGKKLISNSFICGWRRSRVSCLFKGNF